DRPDDVEAGLARVDDDDAEAAVYRHRRHREERLELRRLEEADLLRGLVGIDLRHVAGGLGPEVLEGRMVGPGERVRARSGAGRRVARRAVAQPRDGRARDRRSVTVPHDPPRYLAVRGPARRAPAVAADPVITRAAVTAARPAVGEVGAEVGFAAGARIEIAVEPVLLAGRDDAARRRLSRELQARRPHDPDGGAAEVFGALVDVLVAVVVGAVADVVQARIDRRVGVVAVAADQRVAGEEPAAPLRGRRGVAERVAVGVGPEQVGDALVDVAVAVVVDVVADLGGGAVDVRAGVVAVVSAAQLAAGGHVAAAS